MKITVAELIDCFEDNHEKLYKKAVRQKLDTNYHYTYLFEEDGSFIVWCGLDEKLFHIKKNCELETLSERYIDSWLKVYFPTAYEKYIKYVRRSKLSLIESQP
jgi:hypothetical protein